MCSCCFLGTRASLGQRGYAIGSTREQGFVLYNNDNKQTKNRKEKPESASDPALLHLWKEIFLHFSSAERKATKFEAMNLFDIAIKVLSSLQPSSEENSKRKNNKKTTRLRFTSRSLHEHYLWLLLVISNDHRVIRDVNVMFG